MSKTIIKKVVKAKKEFQPIAPGVYTITPNEFAVKETKAGDGEYLSAEFSYVSEDPELKDRRIWHNFMIRLGKGKEKGESIGHQNLDYFLKAVGVMGGLEEVEFDKENFDPSFLGDYMDKKFNAKIDIQSGNGEYKDKNVIKGFYSL